ncbi:hypothetical protein BV898_09214 [Hypsibius exemplaris]|uniref:Uncharacterized protein n=1 Tax=Hypsibius exemplaris TaxID=2072580 RepID=A0A1W0WNJ7_HYPEX|nr:hypothetical protein BV898_09214 [Hypsibius exemplaris]
METLVFAVLVGVVACAPNKLEGKFIWDLLKWYNAEGIRMQLWMHFGLCLHFNYNRGPVNVLWSIATYGVYILTGAKTIAICGKMLTAKFKPWRRPNAVLPGVATIATLGMAIIPAVPAVVTANESDSPSARTPTTTTTTFCTGVKTVTVIV